MSQSVPPLVHWYRGFVRRFFESADPKRIESADAECARLEALEASYTEEVPVCFLGLAGVGKSTLINALVGHNLLPHGGIGPLTAQALSIRYAEHTSFQVQYHKPDRVWRVAFALQQTHLAELRRQGRTVDVPKDDDPLAGGVDDEDEQSPESPLAKKNLPDEEQEERNRELRKQALVMVAGRQETERDAPYLVDRLREVIGKVPVFGTECLAEDQARIEALRNAVARGKEEKAHVCLESDGDFRAALHDHAAGFLAPVIKELVVRWPSELLRSGIVLVDLPGVGIAGDVHAKVTERFIREKAQVVVLVASIRGVTQFDAELLRKSGFLNRLLHAADDPTADPVQLVMAVVKGDDVAEARYADNRSRKKREHFADVCAEAITARTLELREHLTDAWRNGERLSEGKQEVLDRLLKSLEVHPVSAVQYRKLLAEDEDDRAFIQNVEESNIPGFQRSLQELADRLNARRRERLENARKLFFSGLTARLRLIREQWSQETRAELEAQALQQDLEKFLQPVRRKFDTRRGEFRAFLRETIPAEIGKLVLEASLVAQGSVTRYLDGLGDAHWKTLQAAVRKGGTHDGTRHIDLPHDFALRFEEPIAEIWGKKLLQRIRKRTKTYAEDCVALVEEVLDWAKGQGARVKISLLEAQRDQIKADAQQLTAVGKELIDELRAEVKNRLVGSIQKPIRARCQKFVERNAHIGPGVKLRVLGLFAELANEAVQAAAEPARELLTLRFQEVEKEIAKVLGSDQDPITSAAEAIVESHEATLRRSDAQRRKGILRQIDELEASSPVPWPTLLPSSEPEPVSSEAA